MPDHIAFFRKSPTPASNNIAIRLLSAQFSNTEVDVFDIASLLQPERLVRGINLLQALSLYGIDILLKRRKLQDCLWRTPYIHQSIQSLVTRHVPPRRFRFSFQIQSLFDASQPGLPHFIYTDHTHLANLTYPGYNPRNQFAASWIAKERSTYHNATRIFTRSSHITASLIEQYGLKPENVQTVYAGLNAEFEPVFNTNNEKYGSKIILFLANDWEIKGGPDLLAAFKLVRGVHPDAHLVIAGCNPAIGYTSASAAENAMMNITIIGKASQEQMIKLYEEASVFCLPTTLEPFGIVLMEALAHKLPIVATRVGIIPDIVTHGENGYLVGAHSVDELASALIRLLNDPETCRQFGECSFRNLVERFNWQIVGMRLREGILSQLESRPGEFITQKRQTGGLSPDHLPRKPVTGSLPPERLEPRKTPSGSLVYDKVQTGSLSPDRLPRKPVTGSLSPDKLSGGSLTKGSSLPPEKPPQDKPS